MKKIMSDAAKAAAGLLGRVLAARRGKPTPKPKPRPVPNPTPLPPQPVGAPSRLQDRDGTVLVDGRGRFLPPPKKHAGGSK